jgi:hypothetical protein
VFGFLVSGKPLWYSFASLRLERLKGAGVRMIFVVFVCAANLKKRHAIPTRCGTAD